MKLMKGGIMFKQYDIVLIPFPFSDLTGAKMRPALILSNSLLNSTDDRICCLITSHKTDQGILLSSDSFMEGKLPFKSWVKPHRLFTVDSKIIQKKLCCINSSFHKKIISVIENYLH